MKVLGSSCRTVFGGVLLFLFVGAAHAAAPASVQSLLGRADEIKTSNHPEFLRLLQDLKSGTMRLSAQERWRLRYLEAWQAAFQGDYDTASSELNALIGQAPDSTLRFRATATLVDILGISHRYPEAFARLSDMLEQLPRITDSRARVQGLGEAGQLLNSAGQYDLASGYAEQLVQVLPGVEGVCKSLYLKMHSRYLAGKAMLTDPLWKEGLDACAAASESVYSNAMRADIAGLQIRSARYVEAIDLLQRNHEAVVNDRYKSLISQFDALLSLAYLEQRQLASARRFALAALDGSIADAYTEPLSLAYKVLYEVERRQKNPAAALAYHEKYMAADKGYLDDVSARALAYQMVKQQVQAKKLQVDTLDKQNRILQLQQALDRKAVVAAQLSIALLLTLLASIGFWLYRLKRSQLNFMKLARRDGLTGIYNRQHFMDEATRVLRYAGKSGRGACLILVDLDHFKLINDTHGHVAGDHVLKRAVAVCQQHLRSTDVFGRLGGEEFGILISECAIDDVLDRAEQIRHAIVSAPADDETQGVVVSASFGVSSTQRSGYELRQLLIEADEALYRAKREGRNRVAFGKVPGFSKPRTGTVVPLRASATDSLPSMPEGPARGGAIPMVASSEETAPP